MGGPGIWIASVFFGTESGGKLHKVAFNWEFELKEKTKEKPLEASVLDKIVTDACALGKMMFQACAVERITFHSCSVGQMSVQAYTAASAILRECALAQVIIQKIMRYFNLVYAHFIRMTKCIKYTNV